MQRSRVFCPPVLAALIGVFTAHAATVDFAKLPPALPRPVDYVREVQPLLEANCYKCHGPSRTENGLRLDDRESALRGGEIGPAVVPGNSAESVLVQAVSHARDDLGRMPKKGDALTVDQVALLRAWIDQGAVWPVAAKVNRAETHWAFQAPVRPPVPGGNRPGQHPIDAFVGARLSSEKLAFAPETDRITLLRRLHFDLVGIPPTISETDAFVADTTPDAYEKVVEKLLASPQYGERWGRQWLDAARYADSDGFEKDKARFNWRYRDWVIQAFNRDLPYDRFIIEQVAGDQLENATEDQRVATGFLRNAMLNEEGGVDPEQFRTDGLFDRMDCIGKSILGLTIQCAQCHSHKFDPISQEEYYRLFAYLNNDHEATLISYAPDEHLQIADIRRRTQEEERRIQEVTPDWFERMARWEDSVRADQPEWQVVPCVNASDNGERFYQYSDGSIRAASYAPTRWTAHFRGTNSLPSVGAFRLEYLNDPNLPCNGPGRSIKGMCALSEFNVEAVDATNPTNKLAVKFIKATADFANAEKDLEPEFDNKSGKRRPYGPIEFAIDGKDDTAWGIDAGPGRRNVPRKAVFLPEQPIAFPTGAVLNFKLMQNHGGWNSDDNMNHNLGRFRLSVTAATNVVADPLPAAVRTIFETPRDRRSPAQVAVVFGYWRTTVPEFKEFNDRISAWAREYPEGAVTLSLLARQSHGPGDERRGTMMFKRGDWLKPGKEVAAGVPAFLHSLPEKADSSRLTLARWMVDRKSPTAARVFANRTWQAYFGTGIVETVEDLGLQAPAPSHRELLDWLALEFMEPSLRFKSPGTPWSIKHLHRVIVSSQAYRQSSRVTPDLYARDPYNRLLARGPRFRVEGEIVRDAALAASGLLNPEMGGAGVFSPAPASLFNPPNSYGPFNWIEVTNSQRYRRAVYTFRRRSTPYPVLANFDTPNGDFSCVRRVRSNTPMQALTSLNEPVFMECARALATRALSEVGPSDADRVSHIFRRVLSRPPSEMEKNELLSLLAKARQRLADGWVSAAELATGRNEKPVNLPAGETPTTLAAYTAVSRVLLNLDESITKE